jgi:hypothetical protein
VYERERMRRITLALIVCPTIAATLAAPAEATLRPLDRRDAALADLALISSFEAGEEILADVSDGAGGSEAEHNPATMFLLSLAVPGTGQLVQGQKRGFIYLLAEAALWTGFYVLDQQGLDERGDYEVFADEHWDYSAYVAWYQENCVECDDCAGDYDCRPVAEHGSQEYYEDIGKYATYWRWWNFDGDESDPGFVWDDYSGGDVAVRNDYWGMRGESNDHLRQARYYMMAALLNHVVSAMDSFLSARTDGGPEDNAQGDLGLEFDVADGGDGMTCALVTRY